MLNSSATSKSDASELANNLLTEYKNTPYADMAALYLAKTEVDKNNYQAAQTHLNWLIKHSDSAAIKQIAKDRAARIYIVAKKPQEALDLLTKVNDESYISAIESIRGDAYLALGNKIKAREL